MSRRSARSGWLRLAAVAAAVVGIDQATKAVAVAEVEHGEKVELLPAVDIVHVLNEGVAFGFLGGSGQPTVLVITAIALALILGWFSLDPGRPGAWAAVGLLIGGALGNLVDRVRQDAVTDFIDLPAWPAFNLADVAITLGAGALVLAALARHDEPAATPDAPGER